MNKFKGRGRKKGGRKTNGAIRISYIGAIVGRGVEERR